MEAWSVYDVAVPAWVNDLTTLDYGRGYWINVTQASALVSPTISFGAARAADVLASGVPTPPATYYTTLRANYGFVPTAGMPVIARIGDTICGQTSTRAVASQIVFAIKVFSADSLDKANCGIPGRLVTFTVGGHHLPATKQWDNSRPQSIFQEFYLPLVER
jgi:hypothetical protein